MARVPLLPLNWNPYSCQITAIPISMKLSVGIYNIQFNETLNSLPIIINSNQIPDAAISVPVSPSLIIQNENLPGYLFVHEVNSGNGFKPASLTEAKVAVAQVYERPKIYFSSVKIYRTQTIQLHIYGEGFTDRFSKMKLSFNSGLVDGNDYTITVLNREELIVTLLDGKRYIYIF